jgi:hypothetical protein
MNIGVLAYGSLIDDPGEELGVAIMSTIPEIRTPFPVEYARSSRSRGGAPTLVPVSTGGAEVKAVIHVLKDGISIEDAMNLVWRRETGKFDAHHRYRPSTAGPDKVQIRMLSAFHGVKTVLYTHIDANISKLTAESLARRAIASARDQTVKSGRDGISYLINAERHEILTPLTRDYKREILRLTESPDLPSALIRVRSGDPTVSDPERAKAVRAFCDDCVWTKAIRTHFSELFEGGDRRLALLQETAGLFFHDLNIALLEYILLQQSKLLDPASSGRGKDNLTSNYLLTLDWTAQTRTRLKAANDRLMTFAAKIKTARNQLIAHTDLRARLKTFTLGSFLKTEEESFWAALQDFVNTAHEEAVGGPFDIDATTQDGDAMSLLHRLADAVDYDDMVKDDDAILQHRAAHRRFSRL